MMMHKGQYRVRFFLFTLLALLLASPGAAIAATFPEPSEVYVNDYAQVLSAADADAIRELLRSVRSQTDIEVAVVTIGSIAEYADPGQTLESFATALFDHWGIGKKETNDGILILFARDDRRVRIEMGAAYGSDYDAAMQRVVDDRMIPAFRNGEYGRGLYEGARGVVESVTKPASRLRSLWVGFLQGGAAVTVVLVVLFIVFVAAGVSCFRSGKKGWGWTFFTIAGSILLMIVLRILFRRKGGKGFGGGRSGGGGASGSW